MSDNKRNKAHSSKRKLDVDASTSNLAEIAKKPRGTTVANNSKKGKQTLKIKIANIAAQKHKPVTRSTSKNNNAIPVKPKLLKSNRIAGKGKIETKSRSRPKPVKLTKVDDHEFDEFDLLHPITGLIHDKSAVGDGIDVDVHESDDDLDRDRVSGDETSSDESDSEIILTKKNLRKLQKDPKFNSFMDRLLDEKLSQRVTSVTPVATATAAVAAPANGNGAVDVNGKSSNEHNTTVRRDVVKSPSDSTLYTPALQKVANFRKNNDVINQISNFVESIRIESESGSGEAPQVPHTPPRRVVQRTPEQPIVNEPVNTTSDGNQGRLNEAEEMRIAREKTDELILQAEQYKAKVEAPIQGMGIDIGNLYNPLNAKQMRDKFITPDGLAPINEQIQMMRNFDQDDDFFHVTCQVDEGLKLKIRRGEFVELDKLLPKEKSMGGRMLSEDDGLFKFGVKEGHPYVAPANDGNHSRINGIKKWDQAFRVYAAIYTEANPGRAGEVWQYVYVIPYRSCVDVVGKRSLL